MKLKDLLKENWEVKDGKVLSNGKLVGYYEFNRDSDSFWVDDVKKGKGQLSFDTKREVEDYFKKNEKDAVKHLQKLRESVNEVSDTAYTIHRMTDAGQNAVQDFIDDNGLDAEKLLKYIKSNPQSKYDVRDYIAGKKGTVGGDTKLRTRFIKMFKESLNEATMHPMTREGALDNLKEVIHNIKPYSKEVVKHCEAAIAIIEKFETR